MGDDTMVMEYPEFVVVEHSIEEMNQRIEDTCNYYHDTFVAKHNEMCDMIVSQYVESRDNFVMMASAALNSIQDRTTAEQMIDNEFAMIEEKRNGEWMEEFILCGMRRIPLKSPLNPKCKFNPFHNQKLI